MLARLRLSVPWLLVILLVACLGPIAVHGAVDPDSSADVRLANASRQQSTTTGAPEPVEVTTTVKKSSGGGAAGDEKREGAPSTTVTTTTSTTASGSTSTTARPGAPTTAPGGPGATATTAGPAAPATPIDEVLLLVNAARAAAPVPCPPLTVDAALARAAQAHSDDMANRTYLDHVNPEGQDPKARAEEQGYTGTAVGENIAQGYPDAAAVMEAWMASDGHRGNIEKCEYTVIGIGVNDDGWYWTQVFGL